MFSSTMALRAASKTASALGSVAARTVRVPIIGDLLYELDVYGEGDGCKVVLLDGGGQTRHSWATTAERLARRGCTAFAVDLRGHGGSFWAPDGDYLPSAIGADIKTLLHSNVIRDAGKGKLVVVGASLGGMASMVACADNPDVDGTVLVDITPFMQPQGGATPAVFLLLADYSSTSSQSCVDVYAVHD